MPRAHGCARAADGRTPECRGRMDTQERLMGRRAHGRARAARFAGDRLNGRYPIDKSLPAEVATAASQLLQYLRYPVFSWAWWWRRMLFFAPIAIVTAISSGNVHGAFAHDAMEGLSVAWRAAVASAWFLGGGVLLAVAVRHSRLGSTLERTLIIVAVIAGFFIAESMTRWSDRYHDELMCAHRGQSECPEPAKTIDDTALGALLEFAVPAGLYFAFGGGFAVVSYFKEQQSWREHERRREREQLQLAKSEADMRLSILQAQVEPHFLFNTLASLRSLVRTDPVRAEATVDALVEHLRATLPKLRERTEEGSSTLAQQVDICRSYLEVMRVRMEPRFTYAIDIPKHLLALPFPPLMLISLVENAVKHGVERKPGPCNITIVAREAGEGAGRKLEVCVLDDGAGLREGIGKGMGLANIRAQLELRYGTQASLTLCNREAGGAQASLLIPLSQT
jgi:hypothetical protein